MKGNGRVRLYWLWVFLTGAGGPRTFGQLREGKSKIGQNYFCICNIFLHNNIDFQISQQKLKSGEKWEDIWTWFLDPKPLFCIVRSIWWCNWETNFLTFRNIIRTATTFALMGWGMRRAPTSKKNMISIIQRYMCWHWETNLWIIWVFDKVFHAKAIKLWHV